jgi:hypothetical protein
MDAASVASNNPIPHTSKDVITGVTTLRGRNMVLAGTEPQGEPLEGLPADDPEVAARLRAYLEFSRMPVRVLTEAYGAAAGRRGHNENQVTVRGIGGFDSPDVATVPRPIGTGASGFATGAIPEASPVLNGVVRLAPMKSRGVDTGVSPKTLPEVEMTPKPVGVRSSGAEAGPGPQTPSAVLPAADGEKTVGDGAPGEHPAGRDTGQEYERAPGKGLGAPDRTVAKTPDFDSELLAKIGPSSETHIFQGNGPGRAFDVTVDKVFASVIERLQATDLEKGRARFEIETDRGQTIRVRLTLDHNIVSARIDAPNEQIRDLLAGHAWELNQRLESEGLIPNDIEFCLAGGREQTANHGARPGTHNSVGDGTPEDDIENFTMVETETYAFESWA